VAWQPIQPAAQREVTYDWAGETLRHIGTVVHACLERMAMEGHRIWPIRTALTALGVPPDELDSASQRVQQALDATLADPRGNWILAPHQDHACEFSASASVNGVLRHIRIDRTFIAEDGTRWIIDYKTSSHQGSDLEAFLDNELQRYRSQLEAYARWFAQSEGRPVRAALYFPLLGAWRELAIAQSA